MRKRDPWQAIIEEERLNGTDPDIIVNYVCMFGLGLLLGNLLWG